MLVIFLDPSIYFVIVTIVPLCISLIEKTYIFYLEMFCHLKLATWKDFKYIIDGSLGTKSLVFLHYHKKFTPM